MGERPIRLKRKPIESEKGTEEQQWKWEIFDGDPETISLHIKCLKG